MMDFRYKNCQVMTPFNPSWDNFLNVLEGPLGCNFRKTNKETTWTCGGGSDKSLAYRILTMPPFLLSSDDANISLRYFDAHGGHCDCEILFNVASRTENELIWELAELEQYERETAEWLRLTQEKHMADPGDYSCVYGCTNGLLRGCPCQCPNGQYRKLLRRIEKLSSNRLRRQNET